jgi:hypothetical protein
VADELVDWFNKADATYRTDLLEVNELNFARFDAKVEQRFAEQDASLERHLGDFRAEMHEAMGRLETRLIRWMVGLWILGLGATVTLLKLWVE